jgi:hypothetical protein
MDPKNFRDIRCREGGNPDLFQIPGFRVALADASLPGMTVKCDSSLERRSLSTEDTRLSQGFGVPDKYIFFLEPGVRQCHSICQALLGVKLHPSPNGKDK